MRLGASISSNKNLYDIGLRSGLSSFLVANTTQDGVILPSLMGAAIRAILGAVWQDCEDLSVLKRIIEVLQLAQCKDWPKGNSNFYI